MGLHLNKTGTRALGVAESFRKGRPNSTLAGVVMRRDLIIDGLALGRTSVGGDDATSSIASLYRRFRRNDINVMLVSGAILSLYNILDPDELFSKTRVPVVCLTFSETSGIEASIRRHFPDSFKEKMRAYGALGPRKRVRLSTGGVVYARPAGIDLKTTKSILDAFTLQGSVPEPIKVARLLARASSSKAASRRD